MGQTSIEWISVNDRLPPLTADYLVTYRYGNNPDEKDDIQKRSVTRCTFFFDAKKWCINRRMQVIAWSELPKPYLNDLETNG